MASQAQDLERGLPEIQTSTISTGPQITFSNPPAAASPAENVTSTNDHERTQQPQQLSRAALMPQRLTSYTSAISSLSRGETMLDRYRVHMGIKNTDDLLSSKSRAAPNVGIYQRVIANEKKSHLEYQFFSCLINGALGLQIIFAAALTALGASNGPRSAVTAFGAMNTILAGLLTFLKGSGLPNRLKFYENEWTKVREYIEQRERDFAHAGAMDSDVDLLGEIAIIERMYENVRRDIEANTPDNYISLSKSAASTNANSQTAPSLARNLSLRAASQATSRAGGNVEKDLRSRYSTATHDLNNNINNRYFNLQNNLDSRLHDSRSYFDSRLSHAEDQLASEKDRLQQQVTVTTNEVDSRFREAQHHTETAMKDMLADTQRRLAESEKTAKKLEEKVTGVVGDAASKVLGFIQHRKDGNGHHSHSHQSSQ